MSGESPAQPGPDRRARALPRAAAAFAALLSGCAVSPRLEPALERADLPAHVELASTPFHPQAEQQCGPAAVATVLGAAGRAASPEVLAGELMVPQRQGSLQPEIAAAIRARDLLPYPTGTAIDDLLAEVAAGRPVLVLQKQGLGPWPAWHYAVVVGYDLERGTVLLRSGRRARLELQAEVFESTWDRAGRWALVALEPGDLPARPDLPRYLAAAAALEALGHAEAARRAYEAALRQWPNEPLPRLGLANLAAARGDWSEAERGYAEALRLAPGSAAAINNRAEAIARLGCPGAARRVLAEGASRVAADDPLRAAMARTLAALEARPDTSGSTDCARFDAVP